MLKSIFSRLLKFYVVRVVAPEVNYILIHPKEDQNPFKFSWEPLLTQEIHKACHSGNEGVVFFDIGCCVVCICWYLCSLYTRTYIYTHVFIFQFQNSIHTYYHIIFKITILICIILLLLLF